MSERADKRNNRDFWGLSIGTGDLWGHTEDPDDPHDWEFDLGGGMGSGDGSSGDGPGGGGSGDPVSRRNGNLIGGAILVAIGVFFLAQEFLNVDLWNLWPLVLVVVGTGMLLTPGRSRRKRCDRVVGGLINLGLGFFFLAFTLGVLDWNDMGIWWPMFPLICGMAMLAGGLSRAGRLDLVARSVPPIAVGVIGLAFTLTPLGALIGGMFQVFGWPLLLVVIGLAVISGEVLRIGLERLGPGRSS